MKSISLPSSIARALRRPPATLLLAFPLLFLLLFFLAPVISLIALSLRTPEGGLTGQYYGLIWREPVYRTTFLRSINLSVKCTLIALAVGYPFAYLLTRLRSAWQTLILVIVIIPLLLNLLASSFAWIVMFQRKGVINWLLLSLHAIDQPLGLLFTQGATLTGMVYVVLPLMILPVFSSLIHIESIYVEAGRSLGATPWTAFWKITLPLSAPGIVAGSLLVFISSFGLYLVPELLGGPTFTLLPYLIQQQTLQFLNWPAAAALSLILVTAIIPALVILQRITATLTEPGP